MPLARAWQSFVLMLLALLVCGGRSATAQTSGLRVTVVDSRTGLPMTDVTIGIQNDLVLVRPQGDGVFLISVAAGTHTVIVSAIGYAVARVTVDVAADAITPVTIALAEGSGSYTEQVNVAAVEDVPPLDARPGRMTLYGRDLQNLRGAILDDPLRAVQALAAVSATDDLYAEFSVRGSSFHHINVTVDGIPSQYLMHTVNDVVDGGSVTMINSETLASIDLQPGSYAQKAGRRLGAEVDMHLREGNRERFQGRAGLSGTSATFLGEGPLPGRRGSWLASVRRSYLDYLIKKIDPNAGLAFGFTDGEAKVTYNLSTRGTVDLTALIGRADFDGDDYDGVNDTASARSRTWLTAVGWAGAIPGAYLTSEAYVTGTRFTNRNPFDAALDSARFNTVGWRVDGGALLGLWAAVDFGGDVEALDGRHTRNAALPASSTLTRVSDYDGHSTAASGYAQAAIAPFAMSRFTLTPGVRLDRWNLTGETTASPWIATSVAATDRTVIKAGAGIYRQFPEFDQVYGLNGGGTDLRHERAVHLDVGLEQRLTSTLSLQVTGFARNESRVMWLTGSESRMVNSRIIPGQFTAKWTNALVGDARGGEIVIRRDTPAGWAGWAGYSYAQLRYDQVAGAESFWANADQRHTLALYGRYPISSRTSISSRYRYGSNFPVTGYLANAAAAPVDPETGGPAFYQLTDARNTARLPPYSRLDVRGEHAFLWGGRRLVLFVEVANVQNRKNLRNTPYTIDRSGRAFGVTGTMMPIVPSAGFVVEF